MKGINLLSLTGELHYVDLGLATQPILAITDVESKLQFCLANLKSDSDIFSFQNKYHRLPLRAFRDFSFDELCKLRYSTSTFMHETVEKLFEEQSEYEIVRKIMSSMWRWRWGAGRGTWNEVVDVWNGIRNFSLGLGTDFEIRLDYTTGYNEFGYSKYSRTYLDGVFAFLVYYKRKYVMTISFSCSEGKRILIQQMQLKERSGNRWLYKFPNNRMEFVIDLFAEYFANFTFCVVDGESLAKKTILNYERGLQRAEERLERNQQWTHEEQVLYGVDIQEDRNEIEVFKTGIDHLKTDLPRLVELYKNCGRYVLGQSVTINHITHYQLELSS